MYTQKIEHKTAHRKTINREKIIQRSDCNIYKCIKQSSVPNNYKAGLILDLLQTKASQPNINEQRINFSYIIFIDKEKKMENY
jgi:hypothetical protein